MGDEVICVDDLYTGNLRKVEKMRSINDMSVLQIDITNACVHECSNCTRLCGHHKKNYFMDWETFKRAVDSLEGYEGTIGLMGGEPTLHPQFERFTLYLNEKICKKKESSMLIKPTRDFVKTLSKEQVNRYETYETSYGREVRIKGAGLWSAMTESYVKNYELIQDVFRHQAVNDHKSVSAHQPLLVARRDLNIPDEEWVRLRDDCWIQNCWSASITPKGCFFCEIAGVLDMMFDGPGGWPIEKGWWKRTPDEFKDQLHWCELCGFALDTYTRNANEELDDMSQTLYEKLSKLGSPKIKNGKYHIMNLNDKGVVEKDTDMQIKKTAFVDEFKERMSRDALKVYQKKYCVIIFDEDNADCSELVLQIKSYINHVEKIILVTNVKKIQELETQISKQPVSIEFVQNKYSWGVSLNEALSHVKADQPIILCSNEVYVENSFYDMMKDMILNPGALLYVNDSVASSYVNMCKEENSYFVLLYKNARVLKKLGWDRVAQLNCLDELLSYWSEKKRIAMGDDIFVEEEEVIKEGRQYAIYGIGSSSYRATRYIQEQGSSVLFYVDSSSKTWGSIHEEKEVVSPKQLLSRCNEIDGIVIASYYYRDILPVLHQLGIQDDKIIISNIFM